MAAAAESVTRPASAPARRGPFLAALSLLLAAGVLFVLERDLVRQARVDRFVAESGLALRRPLETASIALEPEPDLAAAAALSIALDDAGSSFASAKWEASARELAEDALRARPGWPLHAHLLAEIAWREDRAARAGAGPARWIAAWDEAARAAPNVLLFRARRVEAILEAWPTLTAEVPRNQQAPAGARTLRAGALDGLRCAFRDPGLVTGWFRMAVDRLGRERAIALLPDQADPLRAAAAVMADRSLEDSKSLLDRADATERAERTAAFRRIEDLSRAGSTSLAQACRAFVTAHPAETLDDRERGGEAARLLALWPSERGAWETDARAALIRTVLAEGEAAAAAASPGLRRALSSLSRVPPPVTADMLDATGDRAGAEKLRKSAAVDPASDDWAVYDLRSARRALSRGDVAAARAELNRLPADRSPGCDASLARLELARLSGDEAGRAEAERRLAELDRDVAIAERWRSAGRLRMCIDPSSAAGRSLVVSLVAPSPAIVAYGWDRSRTGSRLVTGESVLTLPLAGRSGVHDFWFAALAGGPVSPGDPSVR